MKDKHISLKEILEKFENGETQRFRTTRMLSSKTGYLEITPDNLIINGGSFGIKKRKTFEWKQVKEIGVNCYEKSNAISFLIGILAKDSNITHSDNTVGFNLKHEYSKSLYYKIWSAIGAFTKIFGQKYIHETLPDSYGFNDEELAFILNSCLEIYNFKKSHF